jgi:hypothetical protein
MIELLRPLFDRLLAQVDSQTVLNYARAAKILNKLNQSAALDRNAPSRDACLARMRDALAAPSASFSPSDLAELARIANGTHPSFSDVLDPPKAP